MRIISGMHRSGTSLVARLFHEAGADMGDPATFYRPDKWNPDGYYEQPAIHEINMPLINGRYGKLSYFRLPSSETVRKRGRQRSESIRTTAEKFRGKVVKEARFCLTLQAWIEQGAKVDKVLFCLRDPIEAARSVQKRNKVPISLALDLWRVHNERLLESLGDIPTWFVYYRNLLAPGGFEPEMAAAFEFMGEEISADRLAELGRSIVKPRMNHHAAATAEYPEPIARLWAELQARHAGQVMAPNIASDTASETVRLEAQAG